MHPPEPDPALDPSTVAALRQALEAADYTHDAVAALLGPVGHAALGRNETTPGLRRTTSAEPLATLTRLWPLQAPVSERAAEAALPGLVAPLVTAGILESSGGEVCARADLRPYSDEDHDWWLLSDLTPGMDGSGSRVDADYVLGVSAASTSLAQLTVRDRVGSALDLGTGCGVQALHLTSHADRVVATDVNRRALAMARLNTALNEIDVDVREGSFFEPVAGELFDLVVTNPPFVISPATHERLVYRDSGIPGDRAVEQIVRDAPGHLAPGGWCQVLANWLVTEDVPWEERLAGWVPPECSVWVVQREVLDPAAYVELWLKDAGLHPTNPAAGAGSDVTTYRERYDAWLGWFEDLAVRGIGFGWINLRHTEGRPVTRFEDWPYEIEQPIGPEIAAWEHRATRLAGLADADLLAQHLVARPDLRQETHGAPGAEDPETIVLRQQRFLRRGRQVDTVEAALVGACDGDLSVAQILDAVSGLLERHAGDTRSAYLPVVRELVEEGFLGFPG